MLGQSLFLIWIIRIGLWLFPFKSLDKWLSYFDSTDVENRNTDWTTIDNVVKSVKACSHYVPYASCLTQALATRKLLQMKGQHSQLKIGVKKDNENFAAHAWIEIDGRIIIGKHSQHQSYLVLKTFGSAIL